MRRIVLALLVTLLAVTLFNCTDKSVQPRVIGEGTYPTAVGTQWLYERYDSVRTVTDTITITIVSQQTLDDGRTAHVTRYKTEDTLRYDTLFLENDSATVKIGNGSVSWVTERYLFPLEVGRAWTVSFQYDSLWVREKNLIATPAGEFPKAYRLERTIFFLNYFHNDEIWFAPGYGVVQQRLRRDFFDPGPAEKNDVWTLIDYTLPE